MIAKIAIVGVLAGIAFVGLAPSASACTSVGGVVCFAVMEAHQTCADPYCTETCTSYNTGAWVSVPNTYPPLYAGAMTNSNRGCDGPCAHPAISVVVDETVCL